MKDLTILMKPGVGHFLVPMKITVMGNSVEAAMHCGSHSASPSTPHLVPPSQHLSRQVLLQPLFAEAETEAKRGLGIRLVGLTPKPVFRHWW